MRYGKPLSWPVEALCIAALCACSPLEPVTAVRCFDSRINDAPPINPSDNKLHIELFNHSGKTAVYTRLDVSGNKYDGIRVVVRQPLKPHSSAVSVTPIDPSQYMYYIDVKGEVDCSVREVRFANGEVWRGEPDGTGHPAWSRILHALEHP